MNRNLPTFHRYLKLRKRMMGVDGAALLRPLRAARRVGRPHLHAGGGAEARPRRRSRRSAPTTRRSRERAFNERWIDLLSRPRASASGAYSNGGAYDVHPYMLLNYNGKYDDVSTLAHELGHTMQSYFSNKTQPYPTADYPIFVAEVASTFNEALLIDHMLKHDQGRRRRGCRCSATTSRTSRARCSGRRSSPSSSCAMHEMAEKGEPLTGDALAKLYLDITKKYYGHDAGRLRRRRLHRARVELHPALLPRLLRLPVRHVVHGVGGAVREGAGRRPGGHEALPGVPRRRRLEVPDRPAEGRGRRHDDRRAAHADDEEDEPRDGRDGEADAQ